MCVIIYFFYFYIMYGGRGWGYGGYTHAYRVSSYDSAVYIAIMCSDKLEIESHILSSYI